MLPEQQITINEFEFVYIDKVYKLNIIDDKLIIRWGSDVIINEKLDITKIDNLAKYAGQKIETKISWQYKGRK